MNDNIQTEEVNNKKLFVGNLPFTVTQEELTEMFAQYGELVNVSLLTDKFSGRSKGFGFVEYTTEEAAQAAIEALHGSDLGGRDMVVNIAKPRAPRDDRGGFKPRRFDSNSRGGYNSGRGNDRGNDRGGDRGSYGRGR